MKQIKHLKKTLSLCLCFNFLVMPNVNAYSLENSSGSLEQNSYESFYKYNEDLNQDLDENIPEINMSSNDVAILYNEFTNKNHNYYNNYDDIPDFVDYTVKNNYIEDTPLARARMSKEGYRNIFRDAAKTLKSSGLFYAGDFLENSLNDNPRVKSYASSSNLSADIKLQVGYKDSKNAIREAIKGLPPSKNTYTRRNSFNLNRKGANKKALDLFLALHGVSYSANAKKVNIKKWNYTMTVTDYYDFKPENYKDSPIVNTVNNYAYGAMKAGAIVPFNIKIIINDSVAL